MNFKPILFSTPMVQSILNGTKTQTRRVIKPQPKSQLHDVKMGYWSEEPNNLKFPYTKCTYGQIGDVLWVRETFVSYEVKVKHPKVSEIEYEYKADESPVKFRWKPGIHMPKEACRLFLKIKDIRVERLQDISRGDAMSEGCPFPNMANGSNPINWYANLWDSINGKCSYASNPWVWVIEFERIEKPENFI